MLVSGVEHQHGDALFRHVGADLGRVDRQRQAHYEAVVIDLDAADQVKVRASGQEPRHHGEFPGVLGGGEQDPGRLALTAARQGAAGELGGEVDAYQALADALAAG